MASEVGHRVPSPCLPSLLPPSLGGLLSQVVRAADIQPVKVVCS